MEVQQARAFLAVAEELHFGQAAERLRVTQPHLSRMIKQIEHTLRVKLFERSTRRVSLTAAGEAVVEPARQLVDASDAVHRVAQETIDGKTGTVHLGFAGASTHESMGEISRTVRRHSPGVTLRLHSSQFSNQGLARVLDETLDADIGRWDFLPAEVASIVVGVEELLVAMPATHPASSATEVSMADLADESWMVLPGGAGSILHNRLNSISMAAGFVPRIADEVPDSWTQIALVGAEMGCALTLDSVRNNVTTSNVVFRPIHGLDTRLEVKLIWKRTNRNPALRPVLSTVRDMLPDPRSA
ncbi:LysR family transcriptional regulator [Corynebacterium glyciniphilum]|uniref:LysR family transcriptional regulator n=1 Tax=Corynebacterium glyciniphilum TaxID=1404244 RepID=UPI00235379BD